MSLDADFAIPSALSNAPTSPFRVSLDDELAIPSDTDRGGGDDGGSGGGGEGGPPCYRVLSSDSMASRNAASACWSALSRRSCIGISCPKAV